MPKCVAVFDNVGYRVREPNPNFPGDKPPVAFAARGEELDLIQSEYDRLRALGAVGTEEDAARAAALSTVTPPDNFAELARAHQESMGLKETKTTNPEQAAAEGAHPDTVSELRDKQAAKDNLARQGSGSGSTLTEDERQEAEKTAAERKSHRPARGESKSDEPD